jgi:beta-glucosidase
LKDKRITPDRINESARRLLRNKFDLGLFDNPYVDLSKINEMVNTSEHENLGFEAQKRSIILLKNNSYEDKPILPLIKQDEKIYMDGFNSENFMDFNLTEDIEEADIILVKLNIVFNGTQSPGTEKFSDLLLSTVFPDQNLNFEPGTLKKMELYSKKAKLITVVNLNRPVILGKINQYSDALIGTFGVNEKAVKAVLIGNHNPKGILPFEIPSSMSEVENQLEDMPDDTLNPTFKKGFGLSYR